jgi:hypothetical protein
MFNVVVTTAKLAGLKGQRHCSIEQALRVIHPRNTEGVRKPSRVLITGDTLNVLEYLREAMG